MLTISDTLFFSFSRIHEFDSIIWFHGKILATNKIKLLSNIILCISCNYWFYISVLHLDTKYICCSTNEPNSAGTIFIVMLLLKNRLHFANKEFEIKSY
jgi:hypothetical protein